MNLHQILAEFRKGNLTEEQTIKMLRGDKPVDPKDLKPKELLTLILNVTSVLLDRQLPTDTASYHGRSQEDLMRLLNKAGKLVPAVNRNGIVDSFINELNDTPEEVSLALDYGGKNDSVDGDDV